jgi:hypothetical protein
MRRVFYSFPLLLPLLLLSVWGRFSSGCANIIPPTGGPRDSAAPTLVKASPGNFATRFNGSTITLEFNEYVQLETQSNPVIVNPSPQKTPDFNARLRTVTVRLRDTLQPNTTYSILFGNAIRDINEANPLKDFAYVFSTGPQIDSLRISGQVFHAETGRPDSTVTLLLYDNESDSAVAKKQPRFTTVPNGQGQFSFNFLPPGNFYLFALKSEGFLRYTSPQNLFAFANQPIASSAAPAEVELRAFVEEKPPPKTEEPAAETGPGVRRRNERQPPFTITAEVPGSKDLLEPLALKPNRKLASFDSSAIVFTDTNNLPISQWSLSLDTATNLLNLIHRWKDNAWYKLILAKGLGTDTSGNRSTEADTLVFKTKSESEYGFVRLKFSGLNVNDNPVVQWVQNESVLQSHPLRTNRLEISLFKPGEYQLRILLDSNKNGRWDTGNYWLKRQPERVLAIDKKFNIRANWENEFDIAF